MKTRHFSTLSRRTEPPVISWLMEQTLGRPELISLAAGFTDHASLPVAETRIAVQRVLSKRAQARAALQYGSAPGEVELQRLTAARFADLDQADPARTCYSPDQVIITHGSQQLLYLVTEALFDPGDIVLVEDPTYFVYLGILQSHGIGARGIRMDRHGLSINHLERVLERLKAEGRLPRVKMLYCVSYFQNPTGRTTSRERKMELLSVLRYYERKAGHPIYCLEDAAYRELRFPETRDVPSALVADPELKRVIYAGTFSKPFATGLRVGFAAVPSPLYDAVLRIKGNHDFGTSNFIQRILIRALADGLYGDHLVALRRRYRRKAVVMTAAIRRHFSPQIAWDPPEGGLYVWARLPRKVRTGRRGCFFMDALERDVLYVPGQVCYASDPTRPRPNHEMRLSFGGADLPAISMGIERLGGVAARWLEP